MNCGLCKQQIRGDEQYVTDHYKCSAEMTRSWSEDIDKLKAALQGAVGVIKTWHGDVAWDIYYANAPEMKQIREVLK